MTVVDAELAALDPDLQYDDLGSIVARRLSGRFVVDEWGLDRDLRRPSRRSCGPAGRCASKASASLPEIGPALLVHNRRVGLSESAVLAAAVRRATDRPLRVTGYLRRSGPWRRFAPLARRLGAVPDDPATCAASCAPASSSACRSGRELLHPFHVGPVPVAPIAAALAAGAPIIPVAVLGLEVGRWWTVRFGRPLPTRRRDRVVDPVELAEATRIGCSTSSPTPAART